MTFGAWPDYEETATLPVPARPRRGIGRTMLLVAALAFVATGLWVRRAPLKAFYTKTFITAPTPAPAAAPIAPPPAPVVAAAEPPAIAPLPAPADTESKTKKKRRGRGGDVARRDLERLQRAQLARAGQ